MTMSRSLLLLSPLVFVSSMILQAQETAAAEQNAVYGDSDLRRQARVKGCSNDTTRSGPVKGQAIGLVVVDSSGRPLLSSLQIIEATRVSVNGARSLASRGLVDCTFDVATAGTGPVAAWVAFKVWTGRTGKVIITRQHLPSTSPPSISTVIRSWKSSRARSPAAKAHLWEAPATGNRRRKSFLLEFTLGMAVQK
jgi:hypothetical protein